MSVAWWSKFPTSPPLDQGAEERYKKREGRMNDVVFLAACKLAGIKATPRQARKWNNTKGLAQKFRNQAKTVL